MTYTTNSVDSLKGPKPAESLAQERASAAFDPRLMNVFLEGLVAKSEQVLDLFQQMERDVVLQPTFQEYDETKPDARARVAARINRMARYAELEDYHHFMRRLNIVTAFDPSLGVRISVNLGLFLRCIKGNGSAAQFNFWNDKRQNGLIKQMYGCFGMTELGHGSNVAGVETTATFDLETDEFVINTPHIGATKWWIGGAAHSATHCVVYARLIVKGKDYGVKTFVVPLRDTNHELNPGVSIGDIGAKMGRDGIDNGWIQFSKVRIPRFFMLQKWCKVSKEGEVTLPPLEQISYISLLHGRVFMAIDSYRIIARFITVALRYAVARRQFKPSIKRPNEENVESQLINYPLHQRRLLPYLALAYLMAVGSNRLEIEHDTLLDDMDDALDKNDKEAINKCLVQTKSVFNDSGSLKSSCTWLAADCLHEARQACGGHGYSGYAGFGKIISDWSVQMTWEGDNNVLAMSCGRTLIKNVEDVLIKNKKVVGTMAFLNVGAQALGETALLTSAEDAANPEKVLTALEVLIIRISSYCLDLLKQNGGDWDAISYQRVLLSKLRTHQYMLETFLVDFKKADASLKPFLTNIVKLYILHSILEAFSSEFIGYGVINGPLKKAITNELIPDYCAKVRSQVITYTDAFQMPDRIINSALGNYDGNVYENFFNVVKQQNPPQKELKAPYNDALQAMLKRQSLEERDRFEKNEEARSILSK
ncbi:uncharacterized protein KQ657_004871 [Scheffersomyces spartinae]|uniref:Acyl-coenzyme A oxidase n=1 Tax=Scheffersomyces spartinae TaxID=45513 RepID=A0A9P7VAD5_9ASCO|nr:uncharacterized protein KQ657_004871 [Scheffersomyces spartinae]KAG7194163.1 hypothetical protein KQ657_004871 [Scheffersomyces spartinae]